MILVEKHIISNKHKNFKQLDNLCFLSKNLYNSALYTIKQNHLETNKFLRCNELEKIMQTNENYNFLPNNTSQQILMVLDRNLKSYFQLLKKWKKDKSKLSGCPKFPKYKDKLKGRNLLVFTKNQFRIKDKYILLPKKCNSIPIKTKIKDKNSINQVRIIPTSGCYKIEIIYKQKEKIFSKPLKYASCDLGINNLATIFIPYNKSIIINGRPLKSINQFYNKKKAVLQSKLKKNHNKNFSKSIQKLTFKRNNKIEDYLHKSSRIIVNYLVKNNITEFIIGYNSTWKQEVNLGKRNNQNFVQIPFYKFINMIKYKCELEGIKVTTHEESYTSKCSALDLESIEKHEEYVGKRIKRGLFISKEGIFINADINGSINILRKVTNETLKLKFEDTISRGYVMYPMKVTPS